jgi:DnaD/phage-associated family protein
MTVFSGFFGDEQRVLALPQEFFERLLPEIQHVLELKLVLHILAKLTQQPARDRWVSHAELFRDPTLLKSMTQEGNPRSPEENLRDAIERVIVRGVFLTAPLVSNGEPDVLLFLNADSGRAAMRTVHSRHMGQPETDLPAVTAERPNLFLLYEHNIGLLTPIIAELIREAAAEYPEDWVREAIQLAAEYNRRNWRYVIRILDRWAREGKDNGTTGEVFERRAANATGHKAGYERFVKS